jgi:hypothetical protein
MFEAHPVGWKTRGEVPLFPVSGRYEENVFGKDPCKSWINPCDYEFKPVLNLKVTR